MKTISCIIPAYNEGVRLQSVLEIVTKISSITEIIIIDDGSLDSTQSVVHNFLKNFPLVKFISHVKNEGKTKAVYDGISASTSEYILLLDADLKGLTVENVTDLIHPIVTEVADMSMSMRGNPWVLRLMGIEYLSGERILSRIAMNEILSTLIYMRGFALEVLVNRYVISHNFRIRVVFWKNVYNPWPAWRKYGFFAGLKKDIKMNYDILKTISLWEVFTQNYKMLKLRV